MIAITAPRVLLLLLLLPIVAVLGRARLRRLPGRRGPLVLSLRLFVLGLLILCIANPLWRIGTWRTGSSVLFLVDSSASVGAAQVTGMTWAERATMTAGSRDTSGVVLFGATPQLAVPPAHYTTLPDPTTSAADNTDIGAAIRLGAALLPSGTPDRLVLVSDGRNTTGDLSSALALALSRHIPVDTVALSPPVRPDVAVSALDVPATARVGDQMPVRITLTSSIPATATIALAMDGQQVQQKIHLPAGQTVLTTQEQLTTQGLHTVHASVSAPGDTIPRNNSLDAVTVAGPAGHVLLVSTGTAPSALTSALERDQLAVQIVKPAALPANPAAYAQDDAVILDNVPATALSKARQDAINTAISADGLGMLVIGGANAYSTGGYANAPLQQALPVRSTATVRPARVPLALMLVIDESGSMVEQVDGVTKVSMAKVAAASAIDHLQVGDSVGVLAFSDENQVIVPFHVIQGNADKARMHQEINAIDAGGGTTIYPALQVAAQNVGSVPTTNRHIVLLTDGQGEEAPFDTLIKNMKKNKVTLSTIGVGEDVDENELQHWATLGGGAFHYVADPRTIPSIVLNETKYNVAEKAVQGTIHVSTAAPSPLLRSLAGSSLPAVGGYALTQAKPSAQVAVQTPNGDPVLASWQYGLGRVAAWTSDDGTEGWAQGWDAAHQPTFWTNTVRWVMRGYVPPPGTPVLTTQNGMLQVSLTLQTASGSFNDTASPVVHLVEHGGTSHTLPLNLVAPGTYQAEQPLSGPGLYTATTGAIGNDPPATGALAVPYSAEYIPGGADTTALAQIAAATGGHALQRPADAFAHGTLPTVPAWQPLWPFLLLLALLLFPVEVGLRLSAMTSGAGRRPARTGEPG